VIFRKSQAKEFEQLRAEVEQYIASHHQGSARAGEPDIPAQIEKLGQLRDQGLITADEFEAKKADLLERM
jgi:Short C-terminal domain